VLGDDKEHAQIQLKLRCASASVKSDLIPTGDLCGYGKTGTPEVYDSDCTSGYCTWVRETSKSPFQTDLFLFDMFLWVSHAHSSPLYFVLPALSSLSRIVKI
jgi:hypothetical protein